MKKMILAILCTTVFTQSSAFYAHVTGPSYTCPNSQLIYHYDDDYGWALVTFTVTQGEIYNEISQTWVTNWSFDRAQYTYLDEYWPFKVRWNNSPNGTVGNIHIKICDGVLPIICSNGDRNVTFGPSPGTPIISGSNFILNCQNQQQSYTATNIPEGWSLTSWNYSSHLQSAGAGVNPKLVSANSTTWQGSETLTGVFSFTTGGNTCGTKNVPKSIWLGKPSQAAQTADGGTYYPGYQICPGNHWVGITWNGPVTSTSWSVTPGISYYTNNVECSFTLPSSGYSSVSISVNATNACGTSSNASFYLTKKTFGCGSFLVATYPNPATDELNVQTSISPPESDFNPYEVVADEVTLVDNMNTPVLSSIPSSSTITFDTNRLPSGQYFLRISFGKENIVKQVIIKK